jgi:hypothetical protein
MLFSVVLQSQRQQGEGGKMESQELFYRCMVELGGGRYQGVQPGAPHLGLEPLIPFCGPCKSTMAPKPG